MNTNNSKDTISASFRFHPVGHGLFYSGQIGDDFSFVYDCGGGQKKKRKAEIETLPRKRLDLLVISHMHKDHVSGIPELLAHCKGVNEIVLPYLNPEEILLIATEYLSSGSNRSLSDDFIKLLRNPEEYFQRSEANITPIKDNETEDEVSEEGYGPEFIWTGPYSKTFRNKFWQFKFFHEAIDKDLTDAFIQELNIKNIDYRNIDQCLNNHLDDLKEAYEKVAPGGDLNRTSLVCLHRPLTKIKCCDTGWCRCDNAPCGGTLLTGDANFNKCMIPFVDHYRAALESVCWTLVPHHGSRHNWHDLLFDVLTGCWQWICCCKHKSSRHPHKQILRTFFSRSAILYACTEQTAGYDYALEVEPEYDSPF